MENSEIFVLLGKILARLDQLEKHILNIENKIGPGTEFNSAKDIRKNFPKIESPANNIREEIEKIRKKHTDAARPQKVDLAGVPGIPDISHITDMVSAFKGRFASTERVEEIQEIKETKDEESNK